MNIRPGFILVLVFASWIGLTVWFSIHSPAPWETTRARYLAWSVAPFLSLALFGIVLYGTIRKIRAAPPAAATEESVKPIGRAWIYGTIVWSLLASAAVTSVGLGWSGPTRSPSVAQAIFSFLARSLMFAVAIQVGAVFATARRRVLGGGLGLGLMLAALLLIET